MRMDTERFWVPLRNMKEDKAKLGSSFFQVPWLLL